MIKTLQSKLVRVIKQKPVKKEFKEISMQTDSAKSKNAGRGALVYARTHPKTKVATEGSQGVKSPPVGTPKEKALIKSSQNIREMESG